MLNVLFVFLGGVLGALSRYYLGRTVNRSVSRLFPWGTLVVNLSGCLVIGIISQNLTFLGARGYLFTDIGFVGAYTTFSSLSYETIQLVESIGLARAMINPLLSLCGGLAAVWIGMRLGMLV